MSLFRLVRVAAVAAAFVTVFGMSEAKAQDSVNPYGGYGNDAAAMLDAINRDHGRPPARPVVRVPRGNGTYELNPYTDRKWRYDSVGMIDQINRDFPNYPRHP